MSSSRVSCGCRTVGFHISVLTWRYYRKEVRRFILATPVCHYEIHDPQLPSFYLSRDNEVCCVAASHLVSGGGPLSEW